MYVERHQVDVTTDSSGDATEYSDVITGRILAIHYAKTDFATGVDFTITGEATGENIWTELDVNASTSRAPRMPTYNQDGTAALYAASGTPVNDHIALARDRVKIVVASGGDTKSGTFYIIVG